MIEKAELERITKAQLDSWEANRGVLYYNVSPLRAKRLSWVTKMRAKLKRKKP